jgi:3-deoxy-D-arabino-heptulosonate 7-phosphate (DAHP) synthase
VTCNPDRYFGSDLNKFIFENCGKKMVVNDIDLIMLKHRQGKNDILRVIESKHTVEKPMNVSQRNVLRKLARTFAAGNSSNIGIDLELYIVYGDQPYTKLRVDDLIKNITFNITGRSKVIQWLEMSD